MRLTPRRGLAAAAVSALVVTGIAGVASPASADDGGVRFLSLYTDGGDASLRYDGYDSTIRLVAERLDPTASISFEYNPDPAATDASAGWVPITGTVSQSAGEFFTVDWAATEGTTPLAGTAVALRVVATSSAGATSDVRNDVVIHQADDLVHSVALASSTGRGYFVQPYDDAGLTGPLLGVSGRTSALDGQVELSTWRSSDGTFQGSTGVAVEPAPCKFICSGPGGGSSYGQFATTYELEALDAGAGDVLVFGAERDTDAVRAGALYAQTIGSVSVTDYVGPQPMGEPVDVVVSVWDTQGAPVAGAEVRLHPDGELVGYTDGAGNLDAVQAAGTPQTYYVNTTDVDAYEGDDDPATTDVDVKSSPYTAEGYTPAATTVIAQFADGTAFDDDEYAPGDLYLQVLDQQGRAFPGPTDLEYRLYPSGTTAPDEYETVTTDAAGRATVAFDPAAPDGAQRIDYRRAGTVGDSTSTFTAGDGALVLTPGASTVAGPVGGEIDYTGVLSVGDQPLAGRTVTVRYTRGVEVVPGRVPDAGIVDGSRRVLTRTLTTDGDGAFAFSVADASERPRASEVGGRLVAATATSVPSESSTLSGNAREQDASATRFGDGKRVKVRLALAGTGQGFRADVLRVNGPASAAGQTVRFYRVVGARRQLITARRLDRNGDVWRLVVADRNSTDPTAYLVRMPTSRRVLASQSATRRVR